MGDAAGGGAERARLRNAAAQLREQATHARLLASSIADPGAQQRLRDYAAELEQQAQALEDAADTLPEDDASGP